MKEDDIISHQLRRMPAVVQQAIDSGHAASVVREISQKHHLHVDQAGALETEAVLALLGVTEPEDFGTNMEKIGIAPELRSPILAELNERLFHPIHEELRKLYESFDGPDPGKPLDSSPTNSLDDTSIGVLPENWNAKITEGTPGNGKNMIGSQLGVAAAAPDPYREPVDEKAKDLPK